MSAKHEFDIDWEDLLEEEEEQEEENEEDEDEDEDEDDDDNGGEKQFSQTEVNRIMSKEKKAGRRSGMKKVLEELGVESIDEAKELLAKVGNTGGDDDKGGKPQDATDDSASRKAKEDADKATKEANRLKLEAKVERRLVRAKIDDAKIDRALRMIDLDDLDDGDADEIDAAIADLRDDLPELFATSESDDDEDTPKKRAPASNPGGVPRKKSKTSPTDRAQARLQNRHGSKLSNK